MATLSLRLPESLHRKLAELAEREGVSLNQLISSAAAEKLAALMTEEYLLRRAGRASRRKFDAVLAKIPNAAPVPGDDLPEGYIAPSSQDPQPDRASQRTSRKPARR